MVANAGQPPYALDPASRHLPGTLLRTLVAHQLRFAYPGRLPRARTQHAEGTSSWAPFSLAVSRALSTVVVTTHGGLDTDAAQQLGHTLVDLIDNQGNMVVVVDLWDMGVLDTAALEIFGKACAAARLRGAELTLSRPRPWLLDQLEALDLASAVRRSASSGQRDPRILRLQQDQQATDAGILHPLPLPG